MGRSTRLASYSCAGGDERDGERVLKKKLQSQRPVMGVLGPAIVA